MKEDWGEARLRVAMRCGRQAGARSRQRKSVDFTLRAEGAAGAFSEAEECDPTKDRPLVSKCRKHVSGGWAQNTGGRQS